MKRKLAFALIMGIITTCIISFTLVSVNVGYSEQFMTIWLRSWCIAYMVVIPAILFIGPQVQKIVEVIFRQQEVSAKSLTITEQTAEKHL